MMTVRELKDMLNKYPDDMQILNGRMSDYEHIIRVLIQHVL